MADYKPPRPFAYWAGISDEDLSKPRRRWPIHEIVGWSVPIALVVVLVFGVWNAFRTERRFKAACRSVGGVPVVELSMQCYLKPVVVVVPDSLWMGR